MLSLESALDEKTRNVTEQTPIFEQLEIYFDQRTEEYNKMKKDIVGKGESNDRNKTITADLKRTHCLLSLLSASA